MSNGSLGGADPGSRHVRAHNRMKLLTLSAPASARQRVMPEPSEPVLEALFKGRQSAGRAT
jgi:hypothetical protein